jgi:O-methyltransferase involved in polyketide biosynthesis
MAEKLKIDLKEIQETLLLPLWGRAVESKKENPRLTDTKAVEIIDRIDYDFSRIEQNVSWPGWPGVCMWTGQSGIL